MSIEVAVDFAINDILNIINNILRVFFVDFNTSSCNQIEKQIVFKTSDEMLKLIDYQTFVTS